MQNGSVIARIARAGAVLVVALSVAGCLLSSGVTISDPIPDEPRPPSGETAIGEREHPRVVAAYGGVYEDSGAERAIARMVGRLVASSDNPSQSYQITILNSPVVNAFALPGGYLYITRGLLALANDSSELAAVISHEMAHVTAKHAIARLKRAEEKALVTEVVATVVDDPKTAQTAIASAELSFAHFSQAQELEADIVGVRTLARAGYDPHAAARFLAAMGRFADVTSAHSGAGKQPDFLSSHPTTPDRITKAKFAARAVSGTDIGVRDRAAYLENVNGMLYGDDPSEGFVRGRSFQHAKLGIAFTAPAGYTMENSSDAVLATDGAGTALRFDGTDIPATMALDDYLRSGWVNGLIENSVRSTSIGGRPAATASAVADGWSFRIAVLRVDKMSYRFIFASKTPTPALDSAFRQTVQSFRLLSDEERLRLKPLRIRVVKTPAGASAAAMAARMRGIDASRRLALFRVLNGLAADEDPETGMQVKLVTD
ncbi:MAG: metalloprotease [Hyphomicrobiales bacterium]|nr:MAG: metalloprotease [Hyphomicrobiales bacterium]